MVAGLHANFYTARDPSIYSILKFTHLNRNCTALHSPRRQSIYCNLIGNISEFTKPMNHLSWEFVSEVIASKWRCSTEVALHMLKDLRKRTQHNVSDSSKMKFMLTS